MTTLQTGSPESIGFVDVDYVSAKTGETGEGLYDILAKNKAGTWLHECQKHVAELRHLPPNWDSYGANPVDIGSIANALEFIDMLAEYPAISAPNVAASPAGNVAFSWSWNEGDRELDVEVTGAGMIRYSFINESEPNHDAEGQTAYPEWVASLLLRR